MALTENKRIQHIVDSSANIAADDFDGRLAYDTTEEAIRMRAGGVAKYASMRGHTHNAIDLTDTMTLSTDQDVSGAKTFLGTGSSLTLSGVDSPYTFVGRAPLTWEGAVDFYAIGVFIRSTNASGSRSCGLFFDTVGVGFSGLSDDLGTVTSNAFLRLDTKEWVSKKFLAQDMVSPGAGSRGLAVGEDGVFIVAPTVTREAIIQPLPLSNRAPAETDVVTSAMKSYGFIGSGTTVEELFYHWDLQHDYIAGTDIVFHVHWINNTTGGGNIKWQIAYQWVQAGDVWPAATTTSQVTAVSTTQWLDQRTDFTISGSGHTYNSRLLVRLFRDPADAADTYTGLGVLTSVGCHYSANPAQP
jgi:hypothetical protein